MVWWGLHPPTTKGDAHEHDRTNGRGARRQEATHAEAWNGLDVIHPGAAGLDLHKEVIVACAPMAAGDTRHPVRKFGTYTSALLELAHWLKQHGVTTVAMEATGVFWLPVIGILRIEGAGSSAGECAGGA